MRSWNFVNAFTTLMQLTIGSYIFLWCGICYIASSPNSCRATTSDVLAFVTGCNLSTSNLHITGMTLQQILLVLLLLGYLAKCTLPLAKDKYNFERETKEIPPSRALIYWKNLHTYIHIFTNVSNTVSTASYVRKHETWSMDGLLTQCLSSFARRLPEV